MPLDDREGAESVVFSSKGQNRDTAGQKLWYLRCSPSVTTGEPVASKRSIVSRIA